MDENELQIGQVFTVKNILLSTTRTYVNLKSLTSPTATDKKSRLMQVISYDQLQR
jgi:hypothetical protein